MSATVRYEPRGGARELLLARDSEVLISGPAGTGKSLAALWKLHYAALGAAGMRGLIVRQTSVSLTGTTLATFEAAVAAEGLASGLLSWFGGSARQPAAYRYSNGSRIMVGGLDRPDKFLSLEVDRIMIDEGTETKLAAYETLISRLRGTAKTYRQIMVCCNPAQPTHWLKMRGDAGATRMILSRHTDNPALYDECGQLTERGIEYMAKLDKLTGVRRLRLKDGLWAAAEGIIFEGFDEAIHVVDALPAGAEHWARFWSVDFGHTHPFVLQCWAVDPDGRLWLYREIYHTKRLVEDHARQILGIVAPGGKWIEPRPQAIVCDHDAEDRATLERHLGMPTQPARKTVKDGIEAVASRLKPAGDGRPRIVFVRGALVERDQEYADTGMPACTIEEFPSYVWADTIKEQPVKEGDDGMDATRYAVAHRDLQPTPDLRWM